MRNSGSVSINHDATSTRRTFYIVLLSLFLASFMFAIIHISTGLHAQLITSRKMVRLMREQLVEAGEERESLILAQNAEFARTHQLRSKAKLITEELLEQQKKSKEYQHELIAAKEDLSALRSNFTATSKRLRAQFNTTLKQLHDRVVMTKQYRTILDKSLEQRVALENSLATIQDGAYNVTQQLKQVKGQLFEAIKVIKVQREDISKLATDLNNTRLEVVRLRGRLRDSGIAVPSGDDGQPSSKSLASRLESFVWGGSKSESSSSVASATATAAGGGASADNNKAAPGSTASSGDWIEYKDKKGNKYYYNRITKTSQWAKPEGFVSPT